MFERFDSTARRVLLLSTDEARLLGQPTVGTEHLLLGLLREEGGMAAGILASCGVSAEAVRAALRREAAAAGTAVATGTPPPFTPAAKEAMALAMREALTLAHEHIASEHLLLGLTLGEGTSKRVLVSLGVDPSHLRQQVLERLPPGGAPGTGTRTARYRHALVDAGTGVAAAPVPVDPAALLTWDDAEEALRELGWRYVATVTDWEDGGLQHTSCDYRPAMLPSITVSVTGAHVTREAFERTAGDRELSGVDGLGDAATCDEEAGTVTVLQGSVVFAVTVKGHPLAAAAAIALARKACDRLRPAAP